jgi:hypothetical protein
LGLSLLLAVIVTLGPFVATRPTQVMAQSSATYNSIEGILYNDFAGSVGYAVDRCTGVWNPTQGWILGPQVGYWGVNGIDGWSCPLSENHATIDLFTTSSNGFPDNVYYNYIDVYSNEAWNGLIWLYINDLHATPSYYYVTSVGIANIQDGTDAYTKFRTRVYVNQFFSKYWGLRFATNTACNPSFTLLTTETCPSITKISVSYQPSVTATPNPTNTIPPSWTPNGTLTDYPTFTPGPEATLPGPTLAIHSTLVVRNNIIGVNATPTDKPCNVADYVYQDSNNLATPCGVAVIYPTLALPTLNLPSPTAYIPANTPTPQPISATPSQTLTPSPTITPTGFISSPSPTPGPSGGATYGADLSGVYNAATSVAGGVQTLVPIGQLSVSLNGTGTPTGLIGFAQNAGNSIGGVIVFARTISMTGFDAGGLITLGLSLIVFTAAVMIFVTVFPLLMYIVRLIIQIVGIILDMV